MILKMIREEYRKNSAMYRGRSFAAFPLTVLSFSFIWNIVAVNYSTIPISSLESFTYALVAFLGLGVGAVGFSSRDAFRNLLGRTNYLVFTSRTLPVSRRKLIIDFIVKDVFYYTLLFLAPLITGFMLATGPKPQMLYLAPGLFTIAVLSSTAFTASSLSVPVKDYVSYGSLGRLGPLSAKSITDLSRSSGGFFKIIFSMGILTAFYWTLVLYFPMTAIFLSNPLLSFSVILGLMGLTVYNWLNRFDDPEDYSHLPIDREKLLKSKKQAYIATAIPLTVITVLLSTWFYSKHLLLSIFTVISMNIYNMAVASYITGLKPNESLFHADRFLKYLGGLSILLVPQLYLSVSYSTEILPWMIAINILALTVGLYSYIYE